MAIDAYKIINATELEANLALIATALRTKLNRSGNLQFPDDYVSAINDLQYDANPNTAADITFEDGSVKVGNGFFANDTTKAMPVGSAAVQANSITIPLNISVDNEGKIDVNGEASQVITANVTPGYITSCASATVSASCAKSQALSTVAGGAITPSESAQTAVAAKKYTLGAVTVNAIPTNYIGSAVPRKSETDVVLTETDVTIPAGYYASDVIITLPEVTE